MANIQMTAQDKRFTVRLMGVVLLGLLVLATILIFFNKAFGWFASNKEVDANGMAVSAYSDDVEADFFSYTYAQKTATATRVDNIADVQVPQYDLIFLQRNRYTPAIIRVAMTGDNDLPESGTITLNILRNTAATLGTAPNTVANPTASNEISDTFTSLMRFTVVKGASLYDADAEELYFNLDEMPYGNNSTLYEVAKDMTGSSDVSKVFTTRTGTAGNYTFTKADSIDLSIAYTASDWNGDTLNIYIYISYDKTLMGYYTAKDTVEHGDITGVGHVIPMINDMLTIAVSHS